MSARRFFAPPLVPSSGASWISRKLLETRVPMTRSQVRILPGGARHGESISMPISDVHSAQAGVAPGRALGLSG